MIDYYKKISEEFDMPRFKRISAQIADYEKSFCYKGFRKSAHFCAEKLRQAGAEVDIISLPADGKTAFLDHILPEAFDIKTAHLELIEPERRPLADLKEEPFCVANRCGSTPKGGVIAEVIEKADIDKSDIKGKIVFVSDIHPKHIGAAVVKKGGIGIISSYSEGSAELPDGTWWINGWGPGAGWYHVREDKKLFCFSIPPGKGKYLGDLFRSGKRVKVHAEVSSRVYKGKIYTVSGLLPGKSQKELVFLAHLYEPMLTDNATGAASLIEICRILNILIKNGELPPLKMGIRFLLSMERYGFAEFFAKKENRKRVLCAVNVDSVSTDPKKTSLPLNLRVNPMSHPFFGDFVLESLTRKHLSPAYPWKIEKGNFSDDTYICDSTIGIPVNWLWSNPGKYHHNSLDREAVDFALAGNITSIIATYAYILTTEAEETGKFGFKAGSLKKMVEGKERRVREEAKGRFKASEERGLSPGDKAIKSIIPGRVTVEVPFCLVRVPFPERQPLPEGLDFVLNWMDGKRDLLRIFEMVEMEKGAALNQQERGKLLRCLFLLSKYGYISIDRVYGRVALMPPAVSKTKGVENG